MGFLKHFFRNVLHEGGPSLATNSFEHLSDEELEAHLEVANYGDFTLTGAVRPSFDLKVTPAQGYRHDLYRDEESRTSVAVLMAAASRDILCELFIELLDPLGNEVDVVLETSHQRTTGGHLDLYREHIDMPVLKSILWDHEDMLLNDGCTGIAVLNPHVPQEVQFDEHKLLIVYAANLTPFERICEARNVKSDDQIKFITEAEHVHSSSDEYQQEFEQLKTRLGMDVFSG